LVIFSLPLADIAGEVAMKAFVVFAVFIWFICGAIGAWMLDDMHWKTIARGPITMVKAYNEAQPYDIGL
jgi:hypothetical protein